MKNIDLKSTKICSFLIIVLFIISVIFPISYRETYKIINYVDASIFDRYATSNKFDENIFFSEEVETETAILEQMRGVLPGFDDISRTQDFARIIYENKEKVIHVISNNSKYIQYLDSVGAAADDLIEWSERIAFIDDAILLSCLYLNFLLIAFLWVCLFGFRKSFYTFSGVVYVISTLSVFSNGISDYLFVNAITMVDKITQLHPERVFNTVSYENIEQYKLVFWQAFKESALTFIIFDTLVQEWKQVKTKRQEKLYRFFLKSVEMQCLYLQQYKNETNAYRAILKVPYAGVCE